MPRPQNSERLDTTIGGVSKAVVSRIRRYAKKDSERKGYESTATILSRIIDEYEKDHPPETLEPKPTYPKPNN